MSEFFNDNAIAHGGFIALFSDGVSRKIESFSVENPGKVINKPDEIGSPDGWAGVRDQDTATGTVQIPSQTGSSLALGMYFTANSAHGALKWVVVGKSPRYQSGEYWKEEVRFQAALFS